MNKKEWKDKLEKEYGWPDNFKFKFEVNKWGSCQYSSAYAIFQLMLDMSEDLDLVDTLAVLDTDISYSRTRRMDEVVVKFREDMLKEYSDVEKLVDELDRIYSIDNIFGCLKNCGFDLWTAADTVMELIHPNYEFEKSVDSPGIGPEGNITAQSENFRTGIICGLLFLIDFVKTSYSFADFDT